MHIAPIFRAGLIAGVLAIAPLPAVAQAGHQGHASPQATPQHKMDMPPLDDARFVEMMGKHHRDGIALSRLEEAKGMREDVRTLAFKIRESQERDLKALETEHSGHLHGTTAGHARATGTAGQSAQTGHAGHAAQRGMPRAAMDEHHKMMEQMAAASLARLQSGMGEAVDQAFLEEMAKHHEMALEMIAKAQLTNSDLRRLADKMAVEQKRELAELKKLQATRQ
jgi:uncharacterized protein (DUF305 family)